MNGSAGRRLTVSTPAVPQTTPIAYGARTVICLLVAATTPPPCSSMRSSEIIRFMPPRETPRARRTDDCRHRQRDHHFSERKARTVVQQPTHSGLLVTGPTRVNRTVVAGTRVRCNGVVTTSTCAELPAVTTVTQRR